MVIKKRETLAGSDVLTKSGKKMDKGLGGR